jgi:hypothetical protein
MLDVNDHRLCGLDLGKRSQRRRDCVVDASLPCSNFEDPAGGLRKLRPRVITRCQLALEPDIKAGILCSLVAYLRCLKEDWLFNDSSCQGLD